MGLYEDNRDAIAANKTDVDNVVDDVKLLKEFRKGDIKDILEKAKAKKNGPT
jgi:hypothetical protein